MRLEKKISLFVVLLIVFIDYFSIGIVYPLFSSMLFAENNLLVPSGTSYAVRGLVLGVLLGLEPLFHFLSTPILGTLSDQKGRKKILIFTLVIATTGHSVGILAISLNNIFFMIISRILVGIGAGNSSVVQASIADMSLLKEKAKNFGLYQMALGTGFTIGPFLGGILSDKSLFAYASYSLPFIFSTIIIVINFLLLIKFYKETHFVSTSVKFNLFMGLRIFKKGFKMKDLKGLFLCSLTFVFGFSFFYEFIPVFLIDKFQFTSSDIGKFYGIVGGVYALSAGILIRPIVNRFSANKIFFWALIMSSAFMLLTATSTHFYALLSYAVFVMFCVALLFPTMSTIISNKVGEKAQGEILGILQAMIAFGFGISPLFSGIIVGIYPIIPIIIGSFCMLLTAIIFANIHFRRKVLD